MFQSAVAAIACVSFTCWIYKLKYSTSAYSIFPRGYILTNQVTHSRLLPLEASHAFTYSTVAFLVSLNALESHQLDLGNGLIFGYGGLWGRLVGLRPNPYLTEGTSSTSIRDKLVDLLGRRGLLNKSTDLEDAWMMTMPSCLGFEGINPLTVYFCYKPGGILWVTVLEVHNTFGESHVYFLEVGKGEDVCSSPSFDHKWTFPRAFHVSPFNDRAGFYTVSVKRPSHSSTPAPESPDYPPPPLPTVSVHLHTPASSAESESSPSAVGPLKLTAILRPTKSVPLTTTNLVFTFLRYPFTLFLSLPRILYVAWILHYKKRLDVFIRPEPYPAVENWGLPHDGNTRVQSPDWPSSGDGGVRWQPPGILEKYSQTLLETFLDRRSKQLGVSIELVAANPSIPRRTFSSSSPANLQERSSSSTLKISYLAPRFFEIILLSPSAEHALLLGSKTEGLFVVSDEALFFRVLSATTGGVSPSSTLSFRQRLRCLPLPPSLNAPTVGSNLSVPSTHILDSTGNSITSTVVIATLLGLSAFEEYVFSLVRARPVKGDEPWKGWIRAAEVLRRNGTPGGKDYNGLRFVGSKRDLLGSIRNLGSTRDYN